MPPKKHKLDVLPQFYEDFEAILNYIARDLGNPIAALKLIDEVEAKVYRCLQNPTSVAVYNTAVQLALPYRRIIVGNYLIFYVVFDDVMEVRRMLYARRDLGSTL